MYATRNHCYKCKSEQTFINNNCTGCANRLDAECKKKKEELLKQWSTEPIETRIARLERYLVIELKDYL